jgi:predicted ribosome quality control (RQC) complex YloA/Tae2 family protein
MKGRKFITVDGFQVAVGRDAVENEELTLRGAGPEDLWLHVAGHPGAHVVLFCREREVPMQSVREAALLAKWYSGLWQDDRSCVHYTRAGKITKPEGTPAGTVDLKEHDALFVDRDDTLVKQIFERSGKEFLFHGEA